MLAIAPDASCIDLTLEFCLRDGHELNHLACPAGVGFWPGYPERIEIHGTKGSAVLTGDRLTAWDVTGDSGEPAPIATLSGSGASDPLAIPLEPVERQFRDFAEAAVQGKKPLIDGEQGYRALEIVLSIYRSCQEGRKITLG